MLPDNKNKKALIAYWGVMVFLSILLIDPFKTKAAITLAEIKVSSASNGATVFVDFTTGSVLEGDVVILYGGHGYRSGTSVGPGTVGYTVIASNYNNQHPTFGAWYKVMGAIPDTSAIGLGSLNTGDGTVYGAYVLRGVDTANIVDVLPVKTGPASFVPNPPAITTQTPGAWVLGLGANIVTDGSRGTVPNTSHPNGGTVNETIDFTADGVIYKTSGPDTIDIGSWPTWGAGSGLSMAIAIRPHNDLPTVVLNNPPDSASITDPTPIFEFTGTDANGESLIYNIQIDSANTFDTGNLIDRVSSSHTGFINTASFPDTSPFNSGQKTSYELPDYLNGLTNGRWYWRVRANDGIGYGNWSSTYSFLLTIPEPLFYFDLIDLEGLNLSYAIPALLKDLKNILFQKQHESFWHQLAFRNKYSPAGEHLERFIKVWQWLDTS